MPAGLPDVSKVAVVWNERAGSAAGVAIDQVLQRLGDRLGAASQIAVYEVTEAEDPGACARRALAAGAALVVAAGGDGTVSSVAAELLGTPVPLAVLPLGTANSFAAALGIPPELDAALALIGATPARAVDAAIVRGPAGQRAMILHCMVGFHADVIATTTTPAKQRWGVLAYAGSALRQLTKLAPFMIEVVAETQRIRCQAIAVAAANLAPPRSVLAHGPSHLLGDDGLLDVTIIAAETIADLAATGLHLYRSARDGEPATRDNVGSFAARSLTITADPVQRVLIDGEEFGDTPVTIETRPHALTVIAPPPEHVEGPPIEASLLGLPELEIEAHRSRS